MIFFSPIKLYKNFLIYIMCPMNIHKRVFEVIDGVKREFVMIDAIEYNNFMM